jgi:hypothetical protein
LTSPRTTTWPGWRTLCPERSVLEKDGLRYLAPHPAGVVFLGGAKRSKRSAGPNQPPPLDGRQRGKDRPQGRLAPASKSRRLPSSAAEARSSIWSASLAPRKKSLGVNRRQKAGARRATRLPATSPADRLEHL